MFTVLIRGVEFHAYHGVPEAERAIGHRYRVDLEMQVDGRADETDIVGDTVDYGSVAGDVISIACGQQFRTVERLARVIGERVMEGHDRVLAVTVTVEKIHPPVPVQAAAAGVRLTIGR